LHRYLRDQLYWTLHAPRQTGKTTFLKSWARELNASGQYAACYISIETCQGVTDKAEARQLINTSLMLGLERQDLPSPYTEGVDENTPLDIVLSRIAKLVAPKPLIILFDEVDVLEGEPLIMFLRLLRGGFAERGVGRFPVSIALVGMRDLKDYITQAKDGKPVNPGSPFNIKEDSVSITNFSKEDIGKLFAQRTAETGQTIAEDALDYVWQQTQGQPWIVNNLFKRATVRVLDEEDFQTVTLEHIKQAREQMILARETHLDALAYRLDDTRVRKVIETLLVGDADVQMIESEGFRLAQDLGLITMGRGAPQVANPIYREILARQMTYGAQHSIPAQEWKWEKEDGTLDMDALMREFQKFWRRHADIWEAQSNYREAFPHLLLMAFLQRILNGGGHIDREYAAGRGRTDLYVEYKGLGYVIEIKLLRSYDVMDEVREEGLEQIIRYRDAVAPNAPAYLVIFDRRDKQERAPWSERIKWEELPDGITILNC
jgi:hypothetical protein